MGLIKVIVPVYNSYNYLHRCIDSILAQTEQCFEVVLIDDGSYDGSSEICDSYVERDSRIHVIHKKNEGLSAARNDGLAYKLNCKYVTFVDSDDWLSPVAFERLLKAITQTGCSMAIGKHSKSESYYLPKCSSTYTISVITPEQCYCDTSISVTPIWGKLFKEELFEKIKFPIGKIYEEYATSWKILFSLPSVAVVSDVVYYYYINVNGIVHSNWNEKKMDIFDALDEKIAFFHQGGFFLAEKRARFKKIKMAEKFLEQIKRNEEFKEYYKDLYEILKAEKLAYDASNDGNNN